MSWINRTMIVPSEHVDLARALAAAAADYAARWGDLTAPTLAECEAFCAGVTLDS